MMKAKIKRLDKDLPLPCYETGGSVGFDILARTETAVEPGKIGLVPGNIIVKVPEGYMLTVAARSSTPLKRGLLTPHGIGVIDHDYCGPEDEIRIQVYNFTNERVLVRRGDRIAQGLFVRVDKFEWEEAETMEKKSRGGFGSTDREKGADGEAGVRADGKADSVADRGHRKIDNPDPAEGVKTV